MSHRDEMSHSNKLFLSRYKIEQYMYFPWVDKL
jgi:hypothetical protein